MKKIAIIIPSLEFGGGAEKIASTIGTNLTKVGYSVHFVTFYDSAKKYQFEGTYLSFNEKRRNNIFSKFIKLISRSYHIASFCKKNNINTVISFMEDANFSSIISKIIFCNKAKIIVSIHHSISAYGKIYQKAINLIYPKADEVVTLTKHEKEFLIDKSSIKREHIHVIYNGIDMGELMLSMKADLGEYKDLFGEKIFTFITMGRLNKIKNQSLLIHAFNIFNKKHPNTQLLIIGDGPLKKDLGEIKNKTKNKRIHFLGNQANPYNFIYNADCFILTSYSESFSISTIEAMCCGLPIISTKTQGTQEILEDKKYGITTKNGDEKDLIENMEKIYLDIKIKDYYKEKSLARAKDFNIEKIIKERSKII